MRFFVLKNCLINDVRNLPNLGDFLTKKLKEIAIDSNFNKTEETEKFKKTFLLLKNALNEDSFKKFSKTKGKYTGAFNTSIYEVIAIGLGKNIDSYDANNPEHIEKIQQISRELQDNSIYQNYSGAGSNAEKLLPLGEELFKL